METITIHKAKTELSRLIEKACRGEEIVIARGKKPSCGWLRSRITTASVSPVFYAAS